MSCGCENENINYLNPGFKCQPDLSQLFFLFLDRRKVGIVKGKDTLVNIDVSDFFIPIDKYLEFNLCLEKDEKRFINVESISTDGLGINTGELLLPNSTLYPYPYTKSNFNWAADIFDYNTNTYVYTSYGLLFSNMSIIDELDFANKIINAINTDPNGLYNYITAEYDSLNHKIIFKTKSSNLEVQRYDLISIYDTSNGFSSIATDIRPRLLYPLKDVLKVLFITASYCDDLPSNKKFVYYIENESQKQPIQDWKKFGNILSLSGADNIDNLDDNLIKSIWIWNKNESEVKLKIIVGI